MSGRRQSRSDAAAAVALIAALISGGCSIAFVKPPRADLPDHGASECTDNPVFLVLDGLADRSEAPAAAAPASRHAASRTSASGCGGRRCASRRLSTVGGRM